MTLRKLLLRVMLWSLGAAALVGVLAMLFFREEIIGRVIGTAVTTGIAAGLLIVLSLLADREKSRSAGTLGMASVVAEYLLGLLMIWGFDALGNYRFEEAEAALMLTIAGITLPAMFCMRMAHIPQARLAGRVGIAVCAVVFLLFTVPAWITSSWMDYGNCAGTATCWAIFGVVATASLAGAGYDRRHWRYVGVLAALAGAVMGTIGIWRDLHQGELAFAIVASLAAVIAHANLVLLCPLKPRQRWLAVATIVCVVLCAAGVDVAIWMGSDYGNDDLLERGTGALGILAGCGSLALLVLAGLNRKIKPKAVLSLIGEYTLICPGCSKKHKLPVGDTRCPTCMLEIHVSFTEPHCPTCNYLLYMLPSDRCPECGTIVRPPAAMGRNETAASPTELSPPPLEHAPDITPR